MYKGIKRHVSTTHFPLIKVPLKILCLDKCYRPQLDLLELLPDIFYVVIQTNLCRAQCTIHMIFKVNFSDG